MDKEIADTIHRRIKYIWEEKIKEDYEDGWLLKEDTLKNAFYFHLRNELSIICAENDIRIFTEFTDAGFKGQKKRPDMVIATMNFDNTENEYYGDYVEEVIAVIEFKFKSSRGVDAIYSDYDKIKDYIDSGINANFYMATIWENADKPTTWIRKNAAWARGKVTELNASYADEAYNAQFYVCEH